MNESLQRRRAATTEGFAPTGVVPEWTRPVPGECRRVQAPAKPRKEVAGYPMHEMFGRSVPWQARPLERGLSDFKTGVEHHDLMAAQSRAKMSEAAETCSRTSTCHRVIATEMNSGFVTSHDSVDAIVAQAGPIQDKPNI